MRLQMRYSTAAIAASLAACITTTVHALGIAPGDVVVYQTRNDVTGGANAAPVTILDISPSTPGLVQSFPLLNVSSPLYSTTQDPIATMALSNGNSEVSFAGWTTKGTTGTLGTTPGIPRGVGAINSGGVYSQPSTYNPATLTTPDQPHAAYSPDDVNWYFGDTSGMYYNGSTTPLTHSDGTLAIKGFGSNTYALHTLPDGNDVGIASQATVLSMVTPAAPTPGITSITYSPLAVTQGAHDFAIVSTINQSPNTVYFTSNNGISKYSLVGGTWTQEGSDLVPGATGIAAQVVSASSVKLYVTVDPTSLQPSGGSLEEITDNSVSGATMNASMPTVLYTAIALDALQGVSLAPLPEPGGLMMILATISVCRFRSRKGSVSIL